MSSPRNNGVTGKGSIARKVEIASLAIALVVVSSILMYVTRGRFRIGMLLFFPWVILPYIAFFATTTYLYRTHPNTALPRTAATTSILMLAFTALVYIDGLLIHPDAQSGLLLFFVPGYLLVGGFVMLGIGLTFGTRIHNVGYCQQCGYDLRGSKERCPECGTLFERTEPEQADVRPGWQVGFMGAINRYSGLAIPLLMLVLILLTYVIGSCLPQSP